MNTESEYINKEIFLTNLVKGFDLIAVCSGTYGTGKTFFASTLAQALAILKKKVLLFDGDWGNSNICKQLGITPNYILGDIFAKNLTINQIITHIDKFGYDLLPGNIRDIGLSSLPIGRLQLLTEDLSFLARSYDKVILDTSSEKQKSSEIITCAAKTIILLVSPDSESTIGAYEILQKLLRQYEHINAMIVVNQVNSLREGEMIYNTLNTATTRFLNCSFKLLGIVRNDMRIHDCLKNQTMLLSRYPTADASIDIFQIAKKIISEEI